MVERYEGSAVERGGGFGGFGGKDYEDIIYRIL